MTSIFTLPLSCNFSRWGWSKLRVMLQSCKVQSRRKQISPLLVCRRGFIVNLAKKNWFGLQILSSYGSRQVVYKKNKQNIKRVAKNSFVTAWLTYENFRKQWHGEGQGGDQKLLVKKKGKNIYFLRFIQFSKLIGPGENMMKKFRMV